MNRSVVAPLGIALALGALACAHAESDVDSTEGNVVAGGPLTVLGAAQRSCSTSSVRALSVQLVEEINCAHPQAITSLDGVPGLAFEKEAFPYAQTPLVEPLTKAASGKTVIHITSMLRTLPQQYLVYQWAASLRCGIPMAARPGSSNHEEGLAVDVDNHAAVLGLLTKAGSCPGPKAPKRACFSWLGEKDAVHFDYQGDGGVELSGESVRAFQRLWNKNHPEDTLKVTGAFDAATEARLKKTPAAGFAVGAECRPAPSQEAPAPETKPSQEGPAPETTPPADGAQPQDP